MATNNKFMVKWLSNVTPELLFAVAWLSIGLLFLVVLYAHQKKLGRRNFRGQGDGRNYPSEVTPKRLKGPPPKKLLP